MTKGIVPTVGTFRKRPILCNAPQESEVYFNNSSERKELFTCGEVSRVGYFKNGNPCLSPTSHFSDAMWEMRCKIFTIPTSHFSHHTSPMKWEIGPLLKVPRAP